MSFHSGNKDGATTMINTGNGVDVYQWDASQAKWVKIGNVVGSSGSTQSTSGKTLYEGKVRGHTFYINSIVGLSVVSVYMISISVK